MPQQERKGIQARRAPEAPLVGAGSDTLVYPPGEETYTPDTPEFHYYTELLRGFFEKMSGWQEILDKFQKKREGSQRGFSVFHLANGFYIRRGICTNWKGDDPPGKVLEVIDETYFNDPEGGLLGDRFHIRPGQAVAGQMLVDLNGEPVEEVEINVGDQTNLHWCHQFLEIKTALPLAEPGRGYHRQVAYRLEHEYEQTTLRIVRGHSIYHPISDEYATHLFDTIDSLIPITASPTPQTERGATPETPTLPLLPLRRLAGQR